MAMQVLGKVGYAVIGVTAAVATALGAATTGAVALVGRVFAVATPVAYPPLSADPRLEIGVGNGLPMQLRGLNFDPNEQVNIFVLPGSETPVTQYLPWMKATTNVAGKFEQSLNIGLPANTPDLFYISAWGKRGYVAPIGPIRLPKAVATQVPQPTAMPTAADAIQLTLVPTSQPTPPPTATPVVLNTAPVGAFYVEVFNNRDLTGPAIGARNEPAIRVNLGNAAAYSARYFGKFNFENTENYEFVIVADDGVRLYIDGAIVLNEWRTGKSRELRVDVPLTSGEHSIQLEYFHKAGNAQVSMRWSVNYSRWEGRYYNTANWTGPVVFKRDDGDADGRLRMDWGDQSPVPGLIHTDNFSAIWERRVFFENSGDYKFNLDLDDGAKVYIDGTEVFGGINAVGPHEVIPKLTRGYHAVQVLYAENTGGAKMKLEWAYVQPAPTPVP